jgi:hypothetical protein
MKLIHGISALISVLLASAIHVTAAATSPEQLAFERATHALGDAGRRHRLRRRSFLRQRELGGHPGARLWRSRFAVHLEQHRLAHGSSRRPHRRSATQRRGARRRRNDGTPLSSTELYDPAGGTWSATTSLFAARRKHTATLLIDGKLFVASGRACRTMQAFFRLESQ